MEMKCTECGSNFVYDEQSLALYQKMGLTPSGVCFLCSTRHRLAFRNDSVLYPRVCDLCKKQMVSVFAPESQHAVYCQTCWWGDAWDPFEHGRDFDFNRPFFEQFGDLFIKTKKLSLLNLNSTNSEYCNYTVGNKNCYLLIGGDFSEDTYYSHYAMHSKECMDTYWLSHCELCFEAVDCDKCYNVSYARYCSGCTDCAFMYDCSGCTDCFGCVNLRNKSYCFFNEQLTREEYKRRRGEYKLSNRAMVEKAQKEFEAFKLKQPHIFAKQVNCQESSGDNLAGCNSARNCFDVYFETTAVSDVFLAGWRLNDVVNANHIGHGTELCAQTAFCPSSNRIIGSLTTFNSSEIWYSYDCHNSNSLFGCSSMRKAEFAILNKQYTKNEFGILKDKIISHMKETGEWGKIFPKTLSPFGYNETFANLIFPLEKKQALQFGFKWNDHDYGTHGKETIKINDVPLDIEEVTDDILKEMFACETCGKNFKIIPQELKLRKKLGVPLPIKDFLCRAKDRLKQRNPLILHHRQCMCTQKHEHHAQGRCSYEFETTYTPDRPEMIYCDACYKKEVY
ncbi:MAG TPA: hypothetical protein DDW36_04100 [Candidatus Magasanikbacteria bacterium]|nr:hypothetical protein [Candidatus Magasanikbacteria bacterium]